MRFDLQGCTPCTLWDCDGSRCGISGPCDPSAPCHKEDTPKKISTKDLDLTKQPSLKMLRKYGYSQ